MIYGIGIDMIETGRMEAAASQAFMRRVFSEAELHMLSERNNGIQQVCGGWTGKEAFIKALGEGAKGVSFRDIQVLRLPGGQPYIELAGQAKLQAEALGISRIHISITNLKELVSAMVVLEKE